MMNWIPMTRMMSPITFVTSSRPAGPSRLVMKGETKIILGGSGCGKSTTIKLVLGLLKPDSGQILVDGEDITNYDEQEMMRIRKKIGWEAPLEVSDRAFLQSYYAGLRARLEGQLLFGRRRADKFDKP